MYRLLCQPKHRANAFVPKNGGMVYLTIIPESEWALSQ